uniref:Peptidase M24 domain-containing protein n=1 Tax=Paramoeba aestuarina TaxID=180227 RepID=A0A7S4KWX1_9EUKA|mmetsp:Transcript_27174/g.42298  ORF Transcript_27174/g.42298 Transcript_27174/m.42298 type:complete len:373 (+) Transcript_27174:23-1141(+)
MADNYEEQDEDTTLTNPLVVEKYKFAARFANKAMDEVKKGAVEGASVFDLCCLGDKIILDECAKVYCKKGESQVDKGIGFPTSISVNDVVCHFSPDAEEGKNTKPLHEGDVVRIDLGCQIDGYVSTFADTLVVGKETVTGKKADVIRAAQSALDIVTHALRPGVSYYAITNLIEKVAQEYGVNSAEGVLSHRTSRYIIDTVHVITGKDTPEGKVRDMEIEENEVWAIDIVMTTGTGKLKNKESRPLVYKKTLDSSHQLKLQASRDVLNEVNQKCQTFPFSVRNLTQKRARIGLQECVRSDVIDPYPILYEKEGEHVAHVKSTILVTPSKIERITCTKFDEARYQTEKKITDAALLDWQLKSLKLKDKKDKSA